MALSDQASSLAPDWILLLRRPRIPVSFHSATTFQDHGKEKTLQLRHWYLNGFPPVSPIITARNGDPPPMPFNGSPVPWGQHVFTRPFGSRRTWECPSGSTRVRWAWSWSPEPGFQAEGPWVGPRLRVPDFCFLSWLWGIRMPALLSSEFGMKSTWMWEQAFTSQ